MQINGLAIQMRNIRAVFNWAIDNEYKDNIYYQNFLLTSRNNRLMLQDKVQNNDSKKKLNYKP